jgi:type I restriction enzyme R subunit
VINKSHFTIFDCFDGTLIEYFKNTTDFEVQLPEKEPIPLEQVIENIWQNIDRTYFVKVLVKRLRRIDRAMSSDARDKFSRFIPEGDMGKFAERIPEMIRNDFTNAMNLLRDKNFQDLLLNYERAKRAFLVGYEIEDDVSSEVMIRVGGDYQKPEDYLDSFAQFVRENPDHIDAIRVLLERPKDWKTGALKELREKLALNKFPEDDLRKAHHLVYHKALADIISMVKHAARSEEQIYSAEERVNKALKRITADKTFTEEQMKWLGYIRGHLIENLTIDLEDFERIPVFERHGGRSIANKVFDNELETLIADINYAIAA